MTSRGRISCGSLNLELFSFNRRNDMELRVVSLVVVGFLITQSVQNSTWFDNQTNLTRNWIEIGSTAKLDIVDPKFIGPMPLMKLGESVPLTDREKEDILKLHNTYRKNTAPPASSMRYLRWNDELALTAQQWANTCNFTHGFIKNWISVDPTVSLGQCLYRGINRSVIRGMELWYDERKYYNIQTMECSIKNCGHYIQLLAQWSHLVGCAISNCRYFYIINCHYYPIGYFSSERPYEIGKPCTLCDNKEGGLCYDNMCVTKEDCEADNLDCKCNLACVNCGKLNRSTCTCQCPSGWNRLDCSGYCKDYDESCEKEDEYKDWIKCSAFDDFQRTELCREMCGECNAFKEPEIKNSCCDGVSCPPGYVLDFDNRPCSCTLLCPGPKCFSLQNGATSKHVGVNVIILLILFLTNRWH